MDFKIEPVITEGLVGILPRRARKIAHKGNFLFFKDNFFPRCAIFLPQCAILICIRRWRFGGGLVEVLRRPASAQTGDYQNNTKNLYPCGGGWR